MKLILLFVVTLFTMILFTNAANDQHEWVKKSTISNGLSNDISTDGTTMATGSLSGVTVYRKDNNGAYSIKLGLDIENTENEDNFASTVSLSGDGNIVAINVKGKIQVFEYNTTAWNKMGDDINTEINNYREKTSGYCARTYGPQDNLVPRDECKTALEEYYGTEESTIQHEGWSERSTLEFCKVHLNEGQHVCETGSNEQNTYPLGCFVEQGHVERSGEGSFEGKIGNYNTGSPITPNSQYEPHQLWEQTTSYGINNCGSTYGYQNSACLCKNAPKVEDMFPLPYMTVPFHSCPACGIGLGSTNYPAVGYTKDNQHNYKESGTRVISLSDNGKRIAVGVPDRLTVVLFEYDADGNNQWQRMQDDGTISRLRESSRGSTTDKDKWREFPVNEGTLYESLFGYSLSLSGNGKVLAVSEPNNGRVRVFSQNEEGVWGTPVGDDIIPIRGNEPIHEHGQRDGINTIQRAAAACGWSVSLSYDGSIIAVGCPHLGFTGAYYSGSNYWGTYIENDDIEEQTYPTMTVSPSQGEVHVYERFKGEPVWRNEGRCGDITKTDITGSGNTGETNGFHHHMEDYPILHEDQCVWPQNLGPSMYYIDDGTVAVGKIEGDTVFGSNQLSPRGCRIYGLGATNDQQVRFNTYENAIGWCNGGSANSRNRCLCMSNPAWTNIGIFSGTNNDKNFGNVVSLSSDGTTLAIGSKSDLVRVYLREKYAEATVNDTVTESIANVDTTMKNIFTKSAVPWQKVGEDLTGNANFSNSLSIGIGLDGALGLSKSIAIGDMSKTTVYTVKPSDSYKMKMSPLANCTSNGDVLSCACINGAVLSNGECGCIGSYNSLLNECIGGSTGKFRVPVPAVTATVSTFTLAGITAADNNSPVKLNELAGAYAEYIGAAASDVTVELEEVDAFVVATITTTGGLTEDGYKTKAESFTDEFEIITSGQCAIPIMTTAECERAAGALNIHNTRPNPQWYNIESMTVHSPREVAYSNNVRHYPYGCYMGTTQLALNTRLQEEDPKVYTDCGAATSWAKYQCACRKDVSPFLSLFDGGPATFETNATVVVNPQPSDGRICTDLPGGSVCSCRSDSTWDANNNLCECSSSGSTYNSLLNECIGGSTGKFWVPAVKAEVVSTKLTISGVTKVQILENLEALKVAIAADLGVTPEDIRFTKVDANSTGATNVIYEVATDDSSALVTNQQDTNVKNVLYNINTTYVLASETPIARTSNVTMSTVTLAGITAADNNSPVKLNELAEAYAEYIGAAASDVTVELEQVDAVERGVVVATITITGGTEDDYKTKAESFTDKFEKITSGQCAQLITSAEDCEAAAAALDFNNTNGLSFYEPREVRVGDFQTLSSQPPGCYLGGPWLKLNSLNTSTTPCGHVIGWSTSQCACLKDVSPFLDAFDGPATFETAATVVVGPSPSTARRLSSTVTVSTFTLAGITAADNNTPEKIEALAKAYAEYIGAEANDVTVELEQEYVVVSDAFVVATITITGGTEDGYKTKAETFSDKFEHKESGQCAQAQLITSVDECEEAAKALALQSINGDIIYTPRVVSVIVSESNNAPGCYLGGPRLKLNTLTTSETPCGGVIGWSTTQCACRKDTSDVSPFLDAFDGGPATFETAPTAVVGPPSPGGICTDVSGGSVCTCRTDSTWDDDSKQCLKDESSLFKVASASASDTVSSGATCVPTQSVAFLLCSCDERLLFSAQPNNNLCECSSSGSTYSAAIEQCWDNVGFISDFSVPNATCSEISDKFVCDYDIKVTIGGSDVGAENTPSDKQCSDLKNLYQSYCTC
jgi:hypothetical protein